MLPSVGTTRIVQWQERHVGVLPVNLDGSREGIEEGCRESTAVIYSGRGRTNHLSYWRIALPNLVCVSPGNQPPSVVATPIEERPESQEQLSPPVPVILTAIAKGQTIEVWSFDLGGGNLPNIEFSWHCIVERQ